MITYPHVAVVILNWNGKKYLEQFLPFLVRSTYPNLQLVVGDNASGDGSIEFVASHYPHIRILQNPTNLGFAEGYNEVLNKVEADYYVLLNSDVEVTPSWIEPVIEMMENDSLIAAAQPKLLSYTQRQLFEYAGAAGGFMDKYGYPFCRGRIFDTVETDQGQYNEPTEVFWASGASLFIKKRCWKLINGFDPSFFAHMEEIDLCWRLKNKGYKIVYCPSSAVYHIGGGTLQSDHPYKTYLNYRNNLVMMLKNLPPHLVFSRLFIRFWLDFISLLKFLLEGKFSHARAINKAHTYFFTHLRANKKKATGKTSTFNHTGLLNKSIVWLYFVKGKKKFTDFAPLTER